jgi:Zn-dependent protease
LLVSLSGPAVNAVLAAIFAVVFVKVISPGLPPGITVPQMSSLDQIVFFASLVNVGLFAFNMIPVPPLDGSVLFERLLPARYWPTYLRYRRYTNFVVIGLVGLNLLLYPHGPLTWALDHVYSWWEGVLGFS